MDKIKSKLESDEYKINEICVIENRNREIQKKYRYL
jgi:hypothetical protein